MLYARKYYAIGYVIPCYIDKESRGLVGQVQIACLRVVVWTSQSSNLTVWSAHSHTWLCSCKNIIWNVNLQSDATLAVGCYSCSRMPLL